MVGFIVVFCSIIGFMFGVVYNCNLKVFWVIIDVIINLGSEKDGVWDVFVIFGNDSVVKIISMFIGDVFYSSIVVDGIFYVFNWGKLMFVVVGIFLSWMSWWGVIFLVNMVQIVVVIGIWDNMNQWCYICYEGLEVDFVVVMQCVFNISCILFILVMSGSQLAYVGGFLVVIVIIVGIVALVWVINLN